MFIDKMTYTQGAFTCSIAALARHRQAWFYQVVIFLTFHKIITITLTLVLEVVTQTLMGTLLGRFMTLQTAHILELISSSDLPSAWERRPDRGVFRAAS